MENKILTSVFPIRFQDCDAFRHLNNAKYLDYFINAREDQFLKYFDINLGEMAIKDGLGWVVTVHNIAYLRPALLMEKVLIETQLIDFNDKWIKVEMRMYDELKTRIKAVNWTELVHVNVINGRPIDHSQEMMEIFKGMHLPIENTHFDERVSIFKK